MERTIDKVFDVEKSQIYYSKDFFRKPEHELMHWRRALEEAIIVGKPRLICPYCKQMLKLCGRSDSRGTISYFSHLYDSDDCEIKTTSHMSKEEINAHRYGSVCESERHHTLKNMIAEVLSTPNSHQAGISSVEIEKRINSPLPYMNWRKPDILAQFNDKKIVFELQLSTTFLSVVVDRDLFYRLHGYYIIWVFNFDDNKEYVNLQNMMCKDIYYANKRNIFIFDKKAQELSQERGELILCSKWLDANGKFSDEEYITLEQLSFDTETYKPYYVDADKLYYDAHPHIKSNLDNLEKSRTEMLQALMERQKRELELLQAECKRIETFKNNIIAGNDKADIYDKDEKKGFIYQGQALSSPIYNNIEWNEDYKMFHLVKARRHGLANRAGDAVVPCKFSRIERLSEHLFLVIEKRQWRIWGSTSILKNESTTDRYSFEEIDYNFSLITFVFKERGGWGEQNKTFLIFPNHNTIEIEKIDKLKMAVIINGREYTINPDGNIYYNVKDDTDIFIVGDNLMGLNKGGIETIHPVYEKLEYVSDKCIYAYNEGLMGILTIDAQTIVPINFNKITAIEYGLYKTHRHYHGYGLYTDTGTMIIPAEYDDIQPLSAERVIIKKEFFINYKYIYKYGILDNKGNFIVPLEYEEIKISDNGFICKKIANNNSSHCIAIYSMDGKELISPSLNAICIDYRTDDIIELTIDTKDSSTTKNKKVWLKSDYTFLLPQDSNVSKIGLFNNGTAECIVSNMYAKIDIDGNISDIVENRPDTIAMICNNGCYGLTNVRGQILIPCKYTTLERMPNGVYIGNDRDLISPEALFINSFTGRLTYLNEWLLILEDYHSNLNKLSIYCCSGKLLGNNYSAIYEKNGYICVERIEEYRRNWNVYETTLYGLYDKQGEQILPTQYRSIKYTYDNIVICNYNNGYSNTSVIANLQSRIKYNATHINKIAEIGGEEYYCLDSYNEKILVNSEFAKSGTYTSIIYDKDEQMIKGFKRGDVYNAVTGELLYNADSLEANKIYEGIITNKKAYGIFVKINGKYDGLIHTSMLEKHNLTVKSFYIDKIVNIRIIKIREDKKLDLDIVV